jgi:hypothetical protein
MLNTEVDKREEQRKQSERVRLYVHIDLDSRTKKLCVRDKYVM